MVTTRCQARALGAVSARKVFDIAELLEKILLDVDDMRTVLLAQRVDQTFKAAINGSVKLKKKLRLLPDTTDEELEINPLLQLEHTTLHHRGWVFGSYTSGFPGQYVYAVDPAEDVLRITESWRGMIVARQRSQSNEFCCELGVKYGHHVYEGEVLDRLWGDSGSLPAYKVLFGLEEVAREAHWWFSQDY